MLFDAKVATADPVQLGKSGDEVDNWAAAIWGNFATTGLLPILSSNDLTITNEKPSIDTASSIQGCYAEPAPVASDPSIVPQFANIALKGTRLGGGKGGRQTRLIYAFDGVLDSVVLECRVNNVAGAPVTVSIQESYNGTDWHEMKYLTNTRSSYYDDPDATHLTEEYAPYTFTGFSPSTRYLRIWQLENAIDNSASVNTYFSGVFLYGTSDDDDDDDDDGTGIVKSEGTADYGVAVYPNPAGSMLYLAGNKNLAKVEIIDLTGAKVRSIELRGVSSAEASVEGLPEGIYLVAIYVEGNSKPQVAKIRKQ
jgi:hypothetical protein